MVILLFNGVLALVVLLNMYSVITQVRRTAEIQYSSFVNLYVFVASVEFALLKDEAIGNWTKFRGQFGFK